MRQEPPAATAISPVRNRKSHAPAWVDAGEGEGCGPLLPGCARPMRCIAGQRVLVTEHHREHKGSPTDVTVRRSVVLLLMRPDGERHRSTGRGPATARAPLTTPAPFETGNTGGETHELTRVSRWRSRSSSSPEVRTVTITRATAAIAWPCWGLHVPVCTSVSTVSNVS